MTQAYICWAELNPQTVDAAPPDAIWKYVGHHSDAYWEALRDIWAKGEDFILIEHDVICRPDVLESFDACPEPWCLYGYSNACHPECQEAWANMFGLTRYRAELIKACPEAVNGIPPEGRDWHNLCDWVAGWHPGTNGGKPWKTPEPPTTLRASGFTHHFHWPAVDHHPWFVSR